MLSSPASNDSNHCRKVLRCYNNRTDWSNSIDSTTQNSRKRSAQGTEDTFMAKVDSSTVKDGTVLNRTDHYGSEQHSWMIITKRQRCLQELLHRKASNSSFVNSTKFIDAVQNGNCCNNSVAHVNNVFERDYFLQHETSNAITVETNRCSFGCRDLNMKVAAIVGPSHIGAINRSFSFQFQQGYLLRSKGDHTIGSSSDYVQTNEDVEDDDNKNKVSELMKDVESTKNNCSSVHHNHSLGPRVKCWLFQRQGIKQTSTSKITTAPKLTDDGGCCGHREYECDELELLDQEMAGLIRQTEDWSLVRKKNAKHNISRSSGSSNQKSPSTALNKTIGPTIVASYVDKDSLHLRSQDNARNAHRNIMRAFGNKRGLILQNAL